MLAAERLAVCRMFSV